MSEYLKEPIWKEAELSPLFNLMRKAASDPQHIETIYDQFVAAVGQLISADASEKRGK